jgi:hypothetical protein
MPQQTTFKTIAPAKLVVPSNATPKSAGSEAASPQCVSITNSICERRADAMSKDAGEVKAEAGEYANLSSVELVEMLFDTMPDIGG